MRQIKNRVSYGNNFHHNIPENNRNYQSPKSSFHQFAKICQNYLWKVNFSYPKIRDKSKYCSVLVESRLVENLEFTIRNTISKLPDNWSHTIICSNINHHKVKDITESISPDINVLNILPENFSRNDYNNLCLSVEFYELFENIEWLLVYQPDTFIFNNQLPIEAFNYSYCGAWWGYGTIEKMCRDMFNISGISVGNGGLSIRNVAFCKRCLGKTEYYKYQTGGDYSLEKIGEDVFFGVCARIEGRLCTDNIAKIFSHEPTHGFIYYPPLDKVSFGAHRVYEYFSNTYEMEQYLNYCFLPVAQKKVYVWGSSDIVFDNNYGSTDELHVLCSNFKKHLKDNYYYSFCRYVEHLVERIHPKEFDNVSKIEICPDNPFFKIEVYKDGKSGLHNSVRIIGSSDRYFGYNFYKYS